MVSRLQFMPSIPYSVRQTGFNPAQSLVEGEELSAFHTGWGYTTSETTSPGSYGLPSTMLSTSFSLLRQRSDTAARYANIIHRILLLPTGLNVQGPAVAVARGCGQCLNFNPTFVIIFMFRHVLSWVRSTRIYFLFPLDNSIKFHKIVGWTILFFASVHTLAHIVNFSE